MPLTGLANAAIDRIAPDPALFAASLAVFGESDLVAYRADSPPSLIVRQAAARDPVIDWARRRYDVEFTATTGVIHHRSEEHTSELQSLMSNSYAVFCLKKNKHHTQQHRT